MTSLKAVACRAQPPYEQLYCECGEMENRLKERQGDLFADRTSTATMRANRLRLWFASMAHVLVCALRRIGERFPAIVRDHDDDRFGRTRRLQNDRRNGPVCVQGDPVESLSLWIA